MWQGEIWWERDERDILKGAARLYENKVSEARDIWDLGVGVIIMSKFKELEG